MRHYGQLSTQQENLSSGNRRNWSFSSTSPLPSNLDYTELKHQRFVGMGGRGWAQLFCHYSNKNPLIEYPFYSNNQTLIIPNVQDIQTPNIYQVNFFSCPVFFFLFVCFFCIDRGPSDETRHNLYPRSLDTLKPVPNLPFKRKDFVGNGSKLPWIKHPLL